MAKGKNFLYYIELSIASRRLPNFPSAPCSRMEGSCLVAANAHFGRFPLAGKFMVDIFFY
jgi:hypothetical protein